MGTPWDLMERELIDLVKTFFGWWPYWLPILMFKIGSMCGSIREQGSRSDQMKRLAPLIPEGWKQGEIAVELDGQPLPVDSLGAASLHIRLFEGHGSGVCISSAGLVLTNAHVVENSAVVEVSPDEATSLLGVVVKSDERRDVAAIMLEKTPPIVARIAPDLPPVGAPIYISGCPIHEGNQNYLTSGIVSKIGPFEFPSRMQVFIHTDCAIAPGNSGGPAFNEQGEVIGIAVAIQLDGEAQKTHMALVIPIKECLEAMNIVMPLG